LDGGSARRKALTGQHKHTFKAVSYSFLEKDSNPGPQQAKIFHAFDRAATVSQPLFFFFAVYQGEGLQLRSSNPQHTRRIANEFTEDKKKVLL
jgi:hypothetical protein